MYIVLEVGLIPKTNDKTKPYRKPVKTIIKVFFP